MMSWRESLTKRSTVRAAKQRKAAYLEEDLRATLNGRLPLCVYVCVLQKGGRHPSPKPPECYL